MKKRILTVGLVVLFGTGIWFYGQERGPGEEKMVDSDQVVLENDQLKTDNLGDEGQRIAAEKTEENDEGKMEKKETKTKAPQTKDTSSEDNVAKPKKEQPQSTDTSGDQVQKVPSNGDIQAENDRIDAHADQDGTEKTGETIQDEQRNQEEETKTQEKAETISEDTISNVQGDISMKDKAKAIKLVFSKLSTDDIKLLKDLASGGLSKEEKKKAIRIAEARYSEEELKIIKELYGKYVKK